MENVHIPLLHSEPGKALTKYLLQLSLGPSLEDMEHINIALWSYMIDPLFM